MLFVLSSLCDGKFIPFQSYWLKKDLRLDILSWWFLICLWFNAAIIAYWKQLSSLVFGFIVAFLFFNHSGESISLSIYIYRYIDIDIDILYVIIIIIITFF